MPVALNGPNGSCRSSLWFLLFVRLHGTASRRLVLLTPFHALPSQGSHTRQALLLHLHLESRQRKSRIVQQTYFRSVDRILALVRQEIAHLLHDETPLDQPETGDEPLAAKNRLLRAFRVRQLVSQRPLAYDTTNFHT